MSPRLRTARSIGIGIARISVVALLSLVLLAGLIPSGALSASRACQTACCAGKPPHEAGACNAFSTNDEQDETPPAAEDADADEHSSHHDAMQMHGAATETTIETATETTLSSGHCQPAEHSLAQRHAPRRAPSKQSSVAAQALTRPCAAECAAAVLSLAQVRRPREAATVSIVVRPRPATLVSRLDSNINPSIFSAARRRRIRPRAPPATLVNLSA